jgi:hypothetical protein
LPVNHGETPQVVQLHLRAQQGSASVINESADLFDAPIGRRQAAGEGDLLEALSERIQWLVERHRTTRRAVDELRNALAERDRRIVELDAKLGGFERLRSEMLSRIDALVGEVDRLGAVSEEQAS